MILALAGPLAGPAAAQSAEPSLGTVVSNILTLDQDKVFAGTKFGMRVAAEIDRRSKALAAENRSIEAQLTGEEQALTEARPTLLPAEFRAKADAFDARVQTIRQEQDTKNKALSDYRDAQRKVFLQHLAQVVADVARERGALVVLDKRLVLISADAIDISAEVAARLDAEIGDGAQLFGPDGAPLP